jgi:hypothetical protein
VTSANSTMHPAEQQHSVKVKPTLRYEQPDPEHAFSGAFTPCTSATFQVVCLVLPVVCIRNTLHCATHAK